jgi:hypothetical protein
MANAYIPPPDTQREWCIEGRTLHDFFNSPAVPILFGTRIAYRGLRKFSALLAVNYVHFWPRIAVPNRIVAVPIYSRRKSRMSRFSHAHN